MLIGITGTDGAGKGAAVKYLVDKKGFIHFSSRALISARLQQKNIPATRENLRLAGNELRKEFGNDAMVKLSLQKARTEGVINIVIESIRALAEVDTLHENGGYLLAIDASQNTRYRRITGRKSSSDDVTFAEFVAHEKLEMNDTDPNGMQKARVMQQADFTIMNDGTLTQMAEKIETFLATIKENSK